jgi:hypothetical protein
MLRHFDRVRTSRGLARDAIAKRVGCARVRWLCLLRIREQLFKGLPLGSRQIRNRDLAAALETGAAETGDTPNTFNVQAIHALPLSRRLPHRSYASMPS